jgi:hypothetical protein
LYLTVAFLGIRVALPAVDAACGITEGEQDETGACDEAETQVAVSTLSSRLDAEAVVQVTNAEW